MYAVDFSCVQTCIAYAFTERYSAYGVSAVYIYRNEMHSRVWCCVDAIHVIPHAMRDVYKLSYALHVHVTH